MSEPITLAAIGATALTEGIRFLYDQAADLLRRMRDRTERPDGPIDVDAGGALDSPLESVSIRYSRAEAQTDAIRALRRELADYADGIAEVDPADNHLLEVVDALRRLLETVYGQRITFRGELRETTGTVIDVHVSAASVDGYVAAVRAKRMGNADVKAELKVGDIGSGGQAVGLDVDDIG
ncbi:hypothetical protein [Streptomyces sp. TLI_185]|uniref:hypothetical protein n=1 Tax=Streptomyces sp. TLI_185 TaxID=2485151 RepID=UPI000F4E8AA9|nr:hypothetical protein [Streptomyces sp. TLI_185]